MTVAEVIKALQECPQDLEVAFDSEGMHKYCYVPVDSVEREHCEKYGFIGLATSAPHSVVCADEHRYICKECGKKFDCKDVMYWYGRSHARIGEGT